MSQRTPPHPQSPAEEVANIVTHALGLLLAVAALVLLVTRASMHADAWRIVTLAVFGTTLSIMYLASTLYHLAGSPRTKHVMRVIDHVAIYLLIAGTYTPFTLVTLRGGWGWGLFGIVWAFAIAGIVFKLFATGRRGKLSMLLYLLMGWLAVVALSALVRTMSTPGLVLLAAGGLAYTFGTVFFVLHRIRFNHAVWHLFVIAGSACHVAAIWLDVLPMPHS